MLKVFLVILIILINPVPVLLFVADLSLLS